MTRRKAVTYVSSALVVYGREALRPERKAAELLARQLQTRAGVLAKVADDQSYDPEGWQALIMLGHHDRHLVAAALMASHGVRHPTDVRPGPEGYVIRRIDHSRAPTILIAGTDSRGCLYGAGAFLRALDLGRRGQVGIPYLKLSGAPALAIRGSDLKPCGKTTDLEMGPWSLEQWEAQVAQLALSGFNLVRRQLFNSSFDVWLDEREWMVEDGPGKAGWERERQINHIIHDYGLAVGISYPLNTIAAAVARDDWHPGSPWPRVACPSIVGARDRILYERLQIFKELDHVDHFIIFPYEVGACQCKACQPWVETYLGLARDTAKHLRRYHPDAKVWLSNQGLGPKENERLWRIIAEERSDWFQMVQYSPNVERFPVYSEPAYVGQTPRRYYAATGALSRTLQETARHVPIDYTLVLGPDVTHVFQPQYGLEHIDPALLRLHSLQSPFARPLGYHQVFRATVGASAGVNLYSEGVYDDLNKALWAGWAWSPDLSPWDVTLDYARWWFGKNAAQLVTEAILLTEANWEIPLSDNDQVEQVVLNLDQAEMHIPPHLLKGNWRWTLWRLRGLLDLLAQRKLNLADEIRQVAHALLLEALTQSRGMVERVQAACGLLDLDHRESSLAQFKDEIRELDGLLYEQIGLHLPAVANLDVELTNLGWEWSELRKALVAHANNGASDFAALRQAIVLCLNYENPGPGGFYDDCGHIGRDLHFVAGHRIPAAWGLDPEGRPSTRTFAAGLGEAEDVVFAYRGLDPQSDYQVRLSLVCPRKEWDSQLFALAAGFGMTDAKLDAVQRLYASGFLVHDDLSLSKGVAEQFTFDLPRQAYSDGQLELRFTRASSGQMVAVSEIWLARRQG